MSISQDRCPKEMLAWKINVCMGSSPRSLLLQKPELKATGAEVEGMELRTSKAPTSSILQRPQLRVRECRLNVNVET